MNKSIQSHARHVPEDVRDFFHKPLDTNTPTIRVLRILPGGRGSGIRCDLKHQPLADDGHLCLSYMWGHERSPVPILVNGCRFQVRQNLWRFLHTARHMGIGDWLWIDAISINQNDVQERNHEVKRMAQVYKLAKHVIIWPEPMFRVSQGEDSCDDTEVPRRKMRTIIYEWAPSLRLRWLVPPLHGPYWNRLWIVQELLLAKTVFVIVGCSMMAWWKIRALLLLHGEMRSSTHLNEIDRWRSSKDRSDPSTFPLISALDLAADRECSDIRDRVYGMLGVITDVRVDDFVVDYSIEPATLLVNITQHFAWHRRSELLRRIECLGEALDLGCNATCLACVRRCREEGVRFPLEDLPESCVALKFALRLTFFNPTRSGREIMGGKTFWAGTLCSHWMEFRVYGEDFEIKRVKTDTIWLIPKIWQKFGI